MKVFLILIIILNVTLLIGLFLWFWYCVKQVETRKKLLAIVPASILTYLFFSIYTAFCPLDSFFEKKWENNTHILLPKDSDVCWSSATYPDLHGDYEAYAILKFSEDNFKEVVQQLETSAIILVDTLKIEEPHYPNGLTTSKFPVGWNSESDYDIFYKVNMGYFRIGVNYKQKVIAFEF